MTDRTVAFLGGGKMAEALISGLIRSGGRTVDEIMVTCRREERAQELAGKYGVTATLDNAEAARWASVLVLMAKPQDMEELLGYVGKVLRQKEVHMDAITATSGSGPAYFFLLAEAMIEACILLGLSRDVATELIVQTMLGSAKMLRDTGKHPVELREMVTSPGGTTIEAIRRLEEAGVRAAFLNAIDAANKRSEELARGGDDDEEA